MVAEEAMGPNEPTVPVLSTSEGGRSNQRKFVAGVRVRDNGDWGKLVTNER